MFGFFKKRSTTTELENSTSAALEDVKRKWIDFDAALIFKDGVPLSEVIEIFAQPIQEFFQNKYPVILLGPAETFWLIVFTAILESETHPKKEVNAAIEELQEKYAY